MTEATQDVDALTFEDALAQLDGIVSLLERGEVPLEESISKFELGMRLARRCEERLNESEKKVAVLLREGASLVEVDMTTGATLARHEGAAPAPTVPSPALKASIPKASIPSANSQGPRPLAPPPDDDDIPF